MSIDALAKQIEAKAAGSGFDGSVKLDLGEDGIILLDGTSVSTADAEADCTIRLARADLEALVSGELSPTAAFMSGKLEVEGDMSVAMALGQFL